ATFFERDVDYYARARDLDDADCAKLVLYDDWSSVAGLARQALREADVGVITSFCPDGLAAATLVLEQQRALKVFYDIDTPVTLAALARDGAAVAGGVRYLEPAIIPELDLYLSFAGGPSLSELRQRWGARRAEALYCSVDPEVHGPVAPDENFRCSLGYLGTYSADRQPAVERLLLRPAELCGSDKFWLVGSMYPPDVALPANVSHCDHLPPSRHASFYCANRLTLNVTRQAMVESGYSPSVRLFEAASCGTPIVSDRWRGLEELFAIDEEILVADSPAEVVSAVGRSDAELGRIAAAARARVLASHTAAARANQLVAMCQAGFSG
ncbi:MAG TPA: glycosyltransferase, partial [Terriglobales bacterium]|nr:glycosyltransferase [Terriglobales bacterium]